MQKSIRIPVAIFLLITLSLACTFMTSPTAIVVTATAGPATSTNTLPAIQPSPLPSNTAVSEPLPTIAGQPTDLAPQPTAAPDVLHFYVSGTVWHDLCSYVSGPIPNPLPAGCINDPIAGLISDGIFSPGEPGISGVIVRLEIDCSYGAFTVLTDANGFYTMSFTVPANSGVTQQKVCVSINATEGQNSSILIPGEWAYPETFSDTAEFEITINVETQNTLNFGWDYQFQ